MYDDVLESLPKAEKLVQVLTGDGKLIQVRDYSKVRHQRNYCRNTSETCRGVQRILGYLGRKRSEAREYFLSAPFFIGALRKFSPT